MQAFGGIKFAVLCFAPVQLHAELKASGVWDYSTHDILIGTAFSWTASWLGDLALATIPEIRVLDIPKGCLNQKNLIESAGSSW